MLVIMQWFKEQGVVEKLVDFIHPAIDAKVWGVDCYFTPACFQPTKHLLDVFPSPCTACIYIPLSLQKCSNASQVLCDMIRVSRESSSQMVGPTPLLGTLERYMYVQRLTCVKICVRVYWRVITPQT